MMATAAVIGVTAGKRLFSSSFYSSDLAYKLLSVHDLGVAHSSATSAKSVIHAKKSGSFGPDVPSNRYTQSQLQSIKALEEHIDTSSVPSTSESWRWRSNLLQKDKHDFESSLEVLILLQKSMLEKQWNLSIEQSGILGAGEQKKTEVTCPGISARQRRTNVRRRALNQSASTGHPINSKSFSSIVSSELLNGNLRGYVKGVISKDFLSHTEVIQLSKRIKAGLSLEKHRSRLKERLGCEPSDEQLASSLKISHSELRSKVIECSLARKKLAMSNVRLVMSIAQKYDNMGAEMADLVQGGLIGLLRGIEKFDSSKGFKISSYVYWWICQGVSRALVENSRTLRLPAHLHERLCLIRNAKTRLHEKGISPSIDKIAETLNMSLKKIRNAKEAVSEVFSLDKEAFPSLNGLPGETLHSYIADNNLENNPWHGAHEWSLKDEVNNLINATLGERETEIIRLYHSLDAESHTWEDTSKQQMIGLFVEKTDQVKYGKESDCGMYFQDWPI